MQRRRDTWIYLAQTDTTVGFLSKDPTMLAKAKNRHSSQPFLRCVNRLYKQKRLARTPKKYRTLVRRSHKTTFLYPNKEAIRVVSRGRHAHFLAKFDFLYSSSANAHQSPYEASYAYQQADILIEDNLGHHDTPPSPIIKLGRKRKKLLR